MVLLTCGRAFCQPSMYSVQAGRKQYALIGVVGFPALPGAIDYRGASREEFLQRAIADAQAYAQAGFNALMIQNVGDLPVATQVGPETVAWLSMLGAAIRSAVAL